MKSEKEKLLEYIHNPITTTARNSMGCSENWYSPYFCIKETFSCEEVEKMDEKEIERLLKLTDRIGETLY